MWSPMPRKVSASFLVPVKQCTTPSTPKGCCLSKMLARSAVASRQCIKSGFPSSLASATWHSNTRRWTSGGEKFLSKSRPHSPIATHLGCAASSRSVGRKESNSWISGVSSEVSPSPVPPLLLWLTTQDLASCGCTPTVAKRATPASFCSSPACHSSTNLSARLDPSTLVPVTTTALTPAAPARASTAATSPANASSTRFAPMSTHGSGAPPSSYLKKAPSGNSFLEPFAIATRLAGLLPRKRPPDAAAAAADAPTEPQLPALLKKEEATRKARCCC
mmetsp:Transcript_6386/g.13402  ORF Transcript_6386/g.13402 Transcript_6386/m.13402 type:complete len:277 (-) Transcript_6386:41-871(-)